jgi:phosphate transport system permease protein
MQILTNTGLYRRRRFVNFLILTISLLTTLFGLFWLFWLLWTLMSHGLRYLHPNTFLQATPPPGSDGGLGNAIVGSLALTAVGILIGAPAGIMAGTYLSEFATSC